jgi:hypothetical protein
MMSCLGLINMQACMYLKTVLFSQSAGIKSKVFLEVFVSLVLLLNLLRGGLKSGKRPWLVVFVVVYASSVKKCVELRFGVLCQW